MANHYSRGEGGTNLRGNRFDGDISENRSIADIKDRKFGHYFTMLSRYDLIDLHRIAEDLVTPWVNLSAEGTRFDVHVHPKRAESDILDRRFGRRLKAVNPEDLEELRELTAEMLRMMSI